MLILGHRGAIFDKGGFHQNSLQAFKEALQVGDGFETDACLNGDGELVVIHEAKYVDPALGVEYCASEHLDAQGIFLLGQRRIDQLTTDETKCLHLKDGSLLPTLREVLELTGKYPSKLIDIELKGHEVVSSVLHLVADVVRQGIVAADGVMLSSFNHPSLEIIRKQAPELRVGAIFVGADQPSVPLFPWKPGSLGHYTALTPYELANPILRRVQPDYVIVPQEILTAETLDMVALEYPNAKLMAWVFTEKNNFDLADLIKRLETLHPTGKIAGMMVDNPRQFSEALPRQLRESVYKR